MYALAACLQEYNIIDAPKGEQLWLIVKAFPRYENGNTITAFPHDESGCLEEVSSSHLLISAGISTMFFIETGEL